MNTNINWSIAKIYLLSRRRQTTVAVLGVTFGISMFILMISFMQGINQFFQDAMLASTPDIHIYNDVKTDYTSSITDEYFQNISNRLVILDHAKPKNINKNLKNAEGIVKDVRRNKHVAAASPVVSAQVFFNYGPAQLNGLVDGVDINQEKKVLNLSGKMMAGKAEDLTSTNDGILLGQGIAERLNVNRGDVVTVLTAKGDIAQLHVVGIFQFGLGAIDNTKAFMTISNVQQLLGKGGDFVTDIHVKLNNINESKALAAMFAKKYGYRSDDWATANASIITTLVARNVATFVVSMAMLVIAGFGIYNIMNILISSKLKDIAILKAEGFTGRDVAAIFLSQSVVIGLIGAVFGIALGLVLCYIVSRIPFPKGDLVSLRFFPVLFKIKYYSFAVVFAVATTFIAGLMPSVKASKCDPVSILRG